MTEGHELSLFGIDLPGPSFVPSFAREGDGYVFSMRIEPIPSAAAVPAPGTLPALGVTAGLILLRRRSPRSIQ